LIVKKRPKNEIDIKTAGGELPQYNMFMAMVERIGQDRRGSPLYKMSSDGKHIMSENERQIIRIINGKKHVETNKVHEPVRDDDLIGATSSLCKWFEEQKEVID
jgi:type I restriction enzyme M protein